MFAKTSVLLLSSLSASALAQVYVSTVTSTITSTFEADGITISPAQATQIKDGLVEWVASVADNPVPLITPVANALTKAGYTPQEIVGDIQFYEDTQTKSGLDALADLATATPAFPSIAFETALPSGLKKDFDAYKLGQACEERQIARSALGLPSDAVATQCVAIRSSASAAAQATGAAAVVRPTGVAGLAGSVFAAGVVGAAAVLL